MTLTTDPKGDTVHLHHSAFGPGIEGHRRGRIYLVVSCTLEGLGLKSQLAFSAGHSALIRDGVLYRDAVWGTERMFGFWGIETAIRYDIVQLVDRSLV